MSFAFSAFPSAFSLSSPAFSVPASDAFSVDAAPPLDAPHAARLAVMTIARSPAKILFFIPLPPSIPLCKSLAKKSQVKHLLLLASFIIFISGKQ